MNLPKVLSVENHPQYMGALKEMLEAAGYEVVAATTGLEAVRLLATTHIDGILLQYDLPDATGSSIRAEMKRVRPDVPILLFTGVGNQTPFLLRFFAAHLRHCERPQAVFEEA
jgi:DNA-binding response OmpR family regulator